MFKSNQPIRGGSKVYLTKGGRVTTRKMGEPYGVAVNREQRDFLNKKLVEKYPDVVFRESWFRGAK